MITTHTLVCIVWAWVFVSVVVVPLLLLVHGEYRAWQRRRRDPLGVAHVIVDLEARRVAREREAAHRSALR